MLTLRILGTLLLLCLYGAATASDLVVKSSTYGVKETMDRLEQVVRDKGLTVFLRIDHGANAGQIGQDLPPAEVLIFGNPMMGTGIMQRDIRAGLDLPLRVLVYQGEEGETFVTYHNPQGLNTRYQTEGIEAIGKAEGALDKLTDAATR